MQRPMMHVILLDGNGGERDAATEKIRDADFPVTITPVPSAWSFLSAVANWTDLHLVVMEHELPLMSDTDTQGVTAAELEALAYRFPGLIDDWGEDSTGGERIFRWMRANGMTMPVVFYTHSRRQDLAPDVVDDLKVLFCSKEGDEGLLVATIKDALQIR